MSDLRVQFDAAAKAARSLSRQPDNATLLRLYALYKQATAGDATGARPGFTDPVGRAKYDAWSALRSTAPEAAMRDYIALVEQLSGA
jgi:acyl-CoA-binding protein